MEQSKQGKNGWYEPASKELIVKPETSLFFNTAKFEHAKNVAKIFAESDMVPAHFKGKVGNCIIALNLAEAFPFESNPHYVSGRLLMVIDEPERAVAYLQRAARLAPADADSLLALSEAYRAMGQEDQARQALEDLLRRDPGHAEALRRLE